MTSRKEGKRRLTNCRWSALAQLTLVEHSLCPLKPPRGGFRHEPEYFYFQGGRRHRATAIVDCPLGLHPKDERLLTRLVALALSGDEPQPELFLGVRYLLRFLGMPEGGSNKKQMRDTIKRLGNVRYRNENFYDPIRKEIRDVKFDFFSYSLPKENESFRPWEISFDPLFFKYCQTWGGFLGFRHQRYNSFRPATGRLFLWLMKLLHKKTETAYHDVEWCCVNVLGMARSMRRSDLVTKFRKCVDDLAKEGVIGLPDGGLRKVTEKHGSGYRFRLRRGPKFRETSDDYNAAIENPAYELLARIGLDKYAIQRACDEFRPWIINEAADLTLTRIEKRLGFHNSPAAFFVDYCQKRAAGTTALPDWYRAVKSENEQKEFHAGLNKLGIGPLPGQVTANSWEVDWKKHLGSEEGQLELEKQLGQEVFAGNRSKALGQLQRQFLKRRESAIGQPTPVGKLLKNF